MTLVNNSYLGLNTDYIFQKDPTILILTSSYKSKFVSGCGGNRGLSYEISKHKDFQKYKRVAVIDASSPYLPFDLKRKTRNFRKEKTLYYYHIMIKTSNEEIAEILKNELVLLKK